MTDTTSAPPPEPGDGDGPRAPGATEEEPAPVATAPPSTAEAPAGEAGTGTATAAASRPMRQVPAPVLPSARKEGAGRPRRVPRDPYGVGPPSSWAAPLLALVALLGVGWLTIVLLNGDFSLRGASRPDTGGAVVPGVPGVPGVPTTRTPAPSNVVIVDPRTNVAGSIVYVKAGNVWVHSGTEAHAITTTGTASMPSWSPDGRWIYYVERTRDVGTFPALGTPRRYAMEVPSLMRIRAGGTGQPETITTGRVSVGEYRWFHWIRQPAPSPDGDVVAVLSDGPNPSRSNVVLQLFDLGSRTYTRPDIPENPPLGHQDPAWRPDGEAILLVQNGRDGSRGAPTLVMHDVESGETEEFAGPGYLAPAWSADGRWVAATRTANAGTDVVILDGRTGAEVFSVTEDGQSWSPVWSPRGDAIAFLHRDGGIIDLRLVSLAGTGPRWTAGQAINLTDASGLDGTSRPGWFRPPDDAPARPSASPDSRESEGSSPSGESSAP